MDAVAPKLSPGAVVVMDDIDDNTYFRDWAEQVGAGSACSAAAGSTSGSWPLEPPVGPARYASRPSGSGAASSAAPRTSRGFRPASWASRGRAAVELRRFAWATRRSRRARARRAG